MRGDSEDAKKASDELRDKIKKDTKSIESDFDKIGASGKRSFADFSESAKNASEIAGAAFAGAAAVAVGLGGTLFGLAKQAADAGTEISRFATLTGLTVESIGAIKIASESAGTSLEEFEEVWESFIEVLIEGGKGADDAKEKLKLAGIDPQKGFQDLEGSVKKGFDAIRAAGTQAEKSAVAMAIFGESGLSVVKTANEMTGGFDEFRRKLIETGAVMNDDGVRQSKEFSKSLGELTREAETASTQFALGFMPRITTAMREISGSVRENKSVWREWGEEIGDILLRLERGFSVVIALMKDAALSARLGIFSGTLTLAALQQNAERYDNDARKKATDAFLNDPNRPDFLKQQDKDIEQKNRPTGKPNLGASDAKKTVKDAGDSFAEQFKKFAKEIDFSITRIKGGAINSGSKHPLSLAGDLSIKGKTIEEIVFALGEGIKKGFRAIDERFVGAIAGVKSTGPNAHFESAGSRKPSLFVENRPDLYGGQAGLDYLKKLDKDRRNKKTSTDDVKKFAEDRIKAEEKANAEIVKKREETDNRILQIARLRENEEVATLTELLAKKLISQKDYDDRVLQGEIDLLAKQKQLLEDRLTVPENTPEDRIALAQEIADVTSEIKVKATEKSTAAIKLETEALEEQKKLIAELADLRREVLEEERRLTDFRKEQERKVLSNDLENARGSDRLTALIVLQEFDEKEAIRRKEIDEAGAARARDNSLALIDDKIKEKDKLIEIENLYKNRLLQSEEEFQAAKKEIEEKYKRDKDEAEVDGVGGGILGGLVDGLGFSVEGLMEKVEPLKGIGDIIGSQFNTIAQGVGNAVKAFVLFGSAGGSFRKFAAEILSSVAAMAAAQAVFELAQGFAALALTYFTGNPKYAASAGAHFTAAAIYGVAAGVTAIAGRVVAGDSFKQQQSGAYGSAGGGGGSGGGSENGQTSSRSFTGGAYSGQGDDTRVVESGVNSPFQLHRHEIDLIGDNRRESMTIEVIKRNVGNNGDLRDLFRRLADDTA